MIAALYARKSTEQTAVTDAEKSIMRQIAHATTYAAEKGWTVATEHIYSDDGISGAEFANRPGFLRLMNALKPTPPFQVLTRANSAQRAITYVPSARQHPRPLHKLTHD